jgi:hypothetical protein
MIKRLKLEHILFLDIETVPQFADYDSLDNPTKLLWEAKTKYQRKETFTPKEFYDRAGIWAEFGKIICISVGYFKQKEDPMNFRVTSFYGEEVDILKDFKTLLETQFNKSKHLLCAHNGKEFDFPYIARRMVILGIDLPEKLNLVGKKPWEVPHLDTLELWKFGDYKTFTSLSLMAHVLGIPSPKNDISGEQVRDVFYKEKNIDKVVAYCEKDTVTVAQIILKLRNQDLLSASEVLSV